MYDKICFKDFKKSFIATKMLAMNDFCYLMRTSRVIVRICCLPCTTVLIG